MNNHTYRNYTRIETIPSYMDRNAIIRFTTACEDEQNVYKEELLSLSASVFPNDIDIYGYKTTYDLLYTWLYMYKDNEPPSDIQMMFLSKFLDYDLNKTYVQMHPDGCFELGDSPEYMDLMYTTAINLNNNTAVYTVSDILLKMLRIITH